jgi:hypothetical protein
MQADIDTLKERNIEIGAAESRGDRAWLEGALAMKLAFQRANEARTIVDRKEFLDAVAPGSDRITQIESIHLYGDRAVVTCIVTMQPGGERYHNLRLFIRREEKWKLLGWANEPLSTSPAVSKALNQ